MREEYTLPHEVSRHLLSRGLAEEDVVYIGTLLAYLELERNIHFQDSIGPRRQLDRLDVEVIRNVPSETSVIVRFSTLFASTTRKHRNHVLPLDTLERMVQVDYEKERLQNMRVTWRPVGSLENGSAEYQLQVELMFFKDQYLRRFLPFPFAETQMLARLETRLTDLRFQHTDQGRKHVENTWTVRQCLEEDEDYEEGRGGGGGGYKERKQTPFRKHMGIKYGERVDRSQLGTLKEERMERFLYLLEAYYGIEDLTCNGKDGSAQCNVLVDAMPWYEVRTHLPVTSSNRLYTHDQMFTRGECGEQLNQYDSIDDDGSANGDPLVRTLMSMSDSEHQNDSKVAQQVYGNYNFNLPAMEEQTGCYLIQISGLQWIDYYFLTRHLFPVWEPHLLGVFFVSTSNTILLIIGQSADTQHTVFQRKRLEQNTIDSTVTPTNPFQKARARAMACRNSIPEKDKRKSLEDIEGTEPSALNCIDPTPFVPIGLVNYFSLEAKTPVRCNLPKFLRSGSGSGSDDDNITTVPPVTMTLNHHIQVRFKNKRSGKHKSKDIESSRIPKKALGPTKQENTRKTKKTPSKIGDGIIPTIVKWFI